MYSTSDAYPPRGRGLSEAGMPACLVQCESHDVEVVSEGRSASSPELCPSYIKVTLLCGRCRWQSCLDRRHIWHVRNGSSMNSRACHYPADVTHRCRLLLARQHAASNAWRSPSQTHATRLPTCEGESAQLLLPYRHIPVYAPDKPHVMFLMPSRASAACALPWLTFPLNTHVLAYQAPRVTPVLARSSRRPRQGRTLPKSPVQTAPKHKVVNNSGHTIAIDSRT